ncbi:MAG: hypothetical protein KBC16_04060 [Candidatus Pacebacteria bacterium]|nr:hypothetical protein [Candidatus Paceibacterota bacterium]
MKIVSANYQDRSSPLRWLIRDDSENPKRAVAVKSVIATGVTFGNSSAYESGFGCAVVAMCKSAVAAELPTEHKGRPLKFAGYRFVDENGAEVPACDTLFLAEDGSMYAIVATKRKRAQKRELATA